MSSITVPAPRLGEPWTKQAGRKYPLSGGDYHHLRDQESVSGNVSLNEYRYAQAIFALLEKLGLK